MYLCSRQQLAAWQQRDGETHVSKQYNDAQQAMASVEIICLAGR